MSGNSISPLILLAAALFSPGLWLMARGFRPRRAGNDPHCPKCDYLLTCNVSGVCPECGSAFTGGTVVRGERHRRPERVLLGLLLLGVGTGFASASILSSMGRIHLYEHKPFTWVLRDLQSTVDATHTIASNELRRRSTTGELSPSQSSSWIDVMLTDFPNRRLLYGDMERPDLLSRAEARTLSAAQKDLWIDQILKDASHCLGTIAAPAQTELRRLIAAGELSPSKRQLLIEQGFDAQTTPSAKWTRYDFSSFLMERLGEEYAARALTPEQEQRLFANCCQLGLKTRPIISPRDRLHYLLVVAGNSPPNWCRSTEVIGVWIDGQKVDDAYGWISRYVFVGDTGVTQGPQPPGRHQLKVSVEITTNTGEASEKKGAVERRERRELIAEFEVSSR